jgi:FkbM family methyltransferase
MLDMRQRPTKSDALRFLLQHGFQPHTIIDVGVQHGTQALLSLFPDQTHVLIEPVEEYRETIKQNYAAVKDAVFIWAATSNQSGTGLLAVANILNQADNTITHAYLTPAPGGVRTREVRLVTLDEVLATRAYEKPYLLKVDVDGHELEVLQGATEMLRYTDCVIVEAPLHTLTTRAQFLESHGFVLWNIVDLCYYYGNLSQVDLIFLSRELKRKAAFDPWAHYAFQLDAWVGLT